VANPFSSVTNYLGITSPSAPGTNQGSESVTTYDKNASQTIDLGNGLAYDPVTGTVVDASAAEANRGSAGGGNTSITAKAPTLPALTTLQTAQGRDQYGNLVTGQAAGAGVMAQQMPIAKQFADLALNPNNSLALAALGQANTTASGLAANQIAAAHGANSSLAARNASQQQAAQLAAAGNTAATVRGQEQLGALGGENSVLSSLSAEQQAANSLAAASSASNFSGANSTAAARANAQLQQQLANQKSMQDFYASLGSAVSGGSQLAGGGGGGGGGSTAAAAGAGA
jgi:hypothetical protein